MTLLHTRHSGRLPGTHSSICVMIASSRSGESRPKPSYLERKSVPSAGKGNLNVSSESFPHQRCLVSLHIVFSCEERDYKTFVRMCVVPALQMICSGHWAGVLQLELSADDSGMHHITYPHSPSER